MGGVGGGNHNRNKPSRDEKKITHAMQRVLLNKKAYEAFLIILSIFKLLFLFKFYLQLIVIAV